MIFGITNNSETVTNEHNEGSREERHTHTHTYTHTHTHTHTHIYIYIYGNHKTLIFYHSHHGCLVAHTTW